MFAPDPTLELVAFGLNIVDDHATDYLGWTVPPLQGCCNDAAAWAMAGALSGLKATSVVNTYAGQMTSVGGDIPPYRLVLNCTRAAFIAQLQARAKAVAAIPSSDLPSPISIFCVSGHGAQEQYLAETVESLCLSDGLLADFELHNLLAQFPAGARVAVFLDTCHSGGMDRALGFRHRPRSSGIYLSRLDDEGREIRPHVTRQAIQANVAIFAACPKNQTALDGQHNGAFTGSVMQVVQQMLETKTRPSWAEAFASATAICLRQFNQQPVATYFGDTTAWDKPFLR